MDLRYTIAIAVTEETCTPGYAGMYPSDIVN